MKNFEKEKRPLGLSCQRDLDFTKTLVENSEHMVEAYLESIFGQAENYPGPSTRNTRGIAVLAAAALSAGIGFGVFPALFEKMLADNDLKERASETERILGIIENRLNILDINQRRLTSVLEENRVGSKIRLFQDNLQELKIRINSINILASQRLDYLQKLTGTPNFFRSYLLSISHPEILAVLTPKNLGIGIKDITDENIIFFPSDERWGTISGIEIVPT